MIKPSSSFFSAGSHDATKRIHRTQGDLSISPIREHGYGCHAAFPERSGDSLSVGAEQSSISDCLASGTNDLPEHSLVEIRFKEICAGTWHSMTIAQDPEAVCVEMLARFGTGHKRASLPPLSGAATDLIRAEAAFSYRRAVEQVYLNGALKYAVDEEADAPLLPVGYTKQLKLLSDQQMLRAAALAVALLR